MREKEEGRKMKQKLLRKRGKKKNATAGRRTPSDFSCSFSANFRRPINRKAGQEGASECDEENLGADRRAEEEKKTKRRNGKDKSAG